MNKKVLILLIIGFLLIVTSIFVRKNIPTKETAISKMSEITKVDGENIESYFYPDIILIKVGYNYLAYKGDDMAVLKLNEDLVSKMDEAVFDGRRYKVVGTSKSFTENQIQELYEWNKQAYSYSVESQIEKENIASAYGNYCLEVSDVVDDWTIGNFEKELANILLEIGIASVLFSIILFIIKKYDYRG